MTKSERQGSDPKRASNGEPWVVRFPSGSGTGGGPGPPQSGDAVPEARMLYGSELTHWHRLRVDEIGKNERLVIYLRGKEVVRVTRENRGKALLLAVLLAVVGVTAAEIVRGYVIEYVVPLIQEFDAPLREWLDRLMETVRQQLKAWLEQERR